jgi:DNA recombination protein RmuC
MTEVVLVVGGILAALVIALGIAARHWYRTKGGPHGRSGITGLDPATQINSLGEQVKGLAGKLEELAKENLTNRLEISNKIAEAIKDIGEVYEQGKTLGQTTTTIATALQGSGQRGSWGEVQLERVAEMVGITKHVSFKWQKTFPTEEDKEKTPDMTVYLPGNRAIPVDAKAPDLNLDGEESTAADSLKDAIKKLSAKKYPDCVPGALDFVVLFVPTESTLASALSENIDLIEYAYRQGVLLTSPLTLLGMLRVVEHGWQQDGQIKNVEKINETARDLCDRINNVIEHVAGIQEGLASAVKSYNGAVASMNTRLLVTVRQMEDLGVAVAKEVVDLEEIPSYLSEPPTPPSESAD